MSLVHPTIGADVKKLLRIDQFPLRQRSRYAIWTNSHLLDKYWLNT